MTHQTRQLLRLTAATAALIVASAVVAACNVVGSGLTGPTWNITAVTTQVPAWQGVIPAADQARYTITFHDGGKADIKADCNQVGASYTTTPGGTITITPGPSTLAACPEDSKGQQFVAALSAATSYNVNGAQLVLRLPGDSRLEFVAAK